MLSADQVREFERRGCLKLGRLLDDPEIELLRAELAAVIAGHTARPPVRLANLSGDEARPVWQIVNIWEASDAFAELLRRREIVEAAAQLIGAPAIRLWHDQVQYKPAEQGGVNMWHQDGPLWPTLLTETMVTAWVALDDVDESNGCMSMVPGSHRWGPVQASYLSHLTDFEAVGEGFEPPAAERVEPVLWPVERGGVSFHHCLVWHGSHGNRSGRPRRAVAFHYMDAATLYRAEGEHLLKPFITAGDREPVTGDRFPIVWTAEAAVA